MIYATARNSSSTTATTKQTGQMPVSVTYQNALPLYMNRVPEPCLFAALEWHLHSKEVIQLLCKMFQVTDSNVLQL